MKKEAATGIGVISVYGWKVPIFFTCILATVLFSSFQKKHLKTMMNMQPEGS